MKPVTKGSIFTSNLKKFKVWQYIGAPFWAPFSKFFGNPIRNTLNIMWDQKSNHLDKNSSFYPKMKCPNRYFQKSDRALEFSNLKMTIRSSEIHYLQIVFSKETKKFSKWAMTLIFCSSECWHFILFRNQKNGAQNGAPECQFCIDWDMYNSNFT